MPIETTTDSINQPVPRRKRRRRRIKCELKSILKELFRIFIKPIRRVTALPAVVILIFYCAGLSVATWLTKLLDDADAQDVYFAEKLSRSFTCQVVSADRDLTLLSKTSPASQLIGDGVDLMVPPSDRFTVCPELCTSSPFGTLIPYYCYHADIQVAKTGGASLLENLARNCSNECLRTGVITHRILTQLPSFDYGYYRRETVSDFDLCSMPTSH